MVARSKLTHRQHEGGYDDDRVVPEPVAYTRPNYERRPSPRRQDMNTYFNSRQLRQKVVLVLSTGGLTTLCCVVAYFVLHSVLMSQRTVSVDQAQGDTYFKRTLAFEVCNGMANQRLALLYGVVLAFELGRTAVLPDFLIQGIQSGVQQVTATGNNSSPMSDLYDVPQFISSMSALGVEVLPPHQAPPRELYTKVDISAMEDPVDELSAGYKLSNHISVGCPLFKLHSYYFSGANNRLMWAVLNSLHPNKQLMRKAQSTIKQMKARSITQQFNFLHLRMESDWVEHCQRWEQIADGRVRNNCMNNTDTIDRVLVNMNVPITEPLYIATFWDEVEPSIKARVMQRLATAGYQVYTAKDFPMRVEVDREVHALIDFEVALSAEKFLGNSVSTFSALVMFQRRYAGLWASYYNTGNVPMAEFLPLDHLPWVFIYSSNTPDKDYLVKAAVRSALRYRTVQPYCLFPGNYSSDIALWLYENGVILLEHKLPWADELWNNMAPFAQMDPNNTSPLYSDSEALLAEYTRIELPVIPALEQYTYVLYTDPSVFFHKKLTMNSFGLPLPSVLGVVVDLLDPSQVDSGVMLMNLPALRETYEDFKALAVTNELGVMFPGYGMGVTGAYLQFYDSAIKELQLPSHFAAKPYHDFDVGAYIVHFEGPAPHHFLNYFKTQKCDYGVKCDTGFKRGLCFYIKKWHTLLNETENDVGLGLWYSCAAMHAPHLQGICVNGGKSF